MRIAPRPNVRIDLAEVNELTRTILGGAIEVHRTIGAGLLESAYHSCLHYELTARGLRCDVQRSIPIEYKTVRLNAPYRIDLIVEDQVVVEVKSVAALLPVHQAQLLTYMRLARCPIGLLINFNVPRLMDGVKRMLNTAAQRQGERSAGAADLS